METYQQRQRASGIHTSNRKAQESILDLRIRRRHYDDEADTRNHRRQGDVVCALLPEVGDEAEGQDANERDHIDGDGHVLHHDAFVAELANKGRDEVLDGLGASGKHVHDGQDVCAPIGEGHLESFLVRGLVGGSGVANTIVLQALDGNELKGNKSQDYVR